MPHEPLDQFMNGLIWKAVPPIILCSIAALLLRELLQWIERRAARAGQTWHTKRGAPPPTNLRIDASAVAPRCPSCNGLMMKRTARRGASVGSEFWGCFGYPRCRGTRPV